jgi:chromosome segregation ATPase
MDAETAGAGEKMFRSVAASALAFIAITASAQTADTPLLTVEQAQQRAQHARELMTAAERKVRAAEKKEQAAYKDLESAQKRMEDAQRAYEEAKMRAEQATQASRALQAEFDQSRAKHQQEYQNLKRAHDAAEAARNAPR